MITTTAIRLRKASIDGCFEVADKPELRSIIEILERLSKGQDINGT